MGHGRRRRWRSAARSACTCRSRRRAARGERLPRLRWQGGGRLSPPQGLLAPQPEDAEERLGPSSACRRVHRVAVGSPLEPRRIGGRVKASFTSVGRT